jgi:hypothetical protein
MSGTGPGLFFMGVGAMILITALLKGGVTNHSIEDYPNSTVVVAPSGNTTQELEVINYHPVSESRPVYGRAYK